MNDSDELLVLRLALLGVIFLFVLVASFSLRSGLRGQPARASSARGRRGADARLVVAWPAQSGLETGAEFVLAGKMTLGRELDNSIVIGDESISGYHAEIESTTRGWYLTDLGSTNGTLVNGRPVTGRRTRLRGGEQITLGAVVVRFQA